MSYICSHAIGEIDLNKCEEYLDSNHMYLGIEVFKELQKPIIFNNPPLLNDFYTRTRQFLIVSCIEIKKRYDFNDPILPFIHIFEPKNALDNTTRLEYPSIFFITKLLHRITNDDDIFCQKIDDEWRMLPNLDLPEVIKNENEIDIFWSKLLNFKSIDDIHPMQNLSEFCLALLSLPHSNADCERVFSKVNLIKTSTRNKLNTDTVQGCILSSQDIKTNFNNCTQFEPSNNLLNSMNSNNLYSKMNDESTKDLSDFYFDD